MVAGYLSPISLKVPKERTPARTTGREEACVVLHNDESTAVVSNRCARCGDMMRIGGSGKMKLPICAQRDWGYGLDREVLDLQHRGSLQVQGPDLSLIHICHL